MSDLQNNINIKLKCPELLVVISLTLVFMNWLPAVTEAQESSLSIYPQTGSFTVDSTFDVSIFLNTGGNNINAVQADLRFNPERLQVVTPTKELSAVETWTFPPSFSNSKGTISLRGGFPSAGINTSQGLISTITFEAISSGETVVNFLDSSKVLLSDEKGTDILSSVNKGTYHIILSPSKGPEIFSETHPDQNKWYRNNFPTFSWNEIRGATGYSCELNDDPYGEPNNDIDTESTFISFKEVEDGIKYFHLKAKKGEVWGGTSHFKIKIDQTPPQEFEPYLEPFSLTFGNYLLIYFDTKDSLSGIDRYEVRIADFTDPKDVVLSGWTRQESPFRFTKGKSGTFRVLVRVFDKAGNLQEGNIRVRTFGSLLTIVSGGIQIRGAFIPWWLIYFLVGIILWGTGYSIFKWIKRKRETLRDRFRREVAEAEKEIEDVRRLKRKIKEMRTLEEETMKEGDRLTEEIRDKEEDINHHEY